MVVHWLAHWAQESKAAQGRFSNMCAQLPKVMCVEVAVEASRENMSLALEKVLRSAQARVGKSKYPVPKEIGTRWPLFSLYRSCDMHLALETVAGVEGDTSLSHLYTKARSHPTLSNLASLLTRMSHASCELSPGGKLHDSHAYIVALV